MDILVFQFNLYIFTSFEKRNRTYYTCILIKLCPLSQENVLLLYLLIFILLIIHSICKTQQYYTKVNWFCVIITRSLLFKYYLMCCCIKFITKYDWPTVKGEVANFSLFIFAENFQISRSQFYLIGLTFKISNQTNEFFTQG